MVAIKNGVLTTETVLVGDRRLTINDVDKIVFENYSTVLNNNTKQKLQGVFDFLEEFSKSKVIYGINTGFGPMAPFKIERKDSLKLQYNLVRSHCSGSGQVVESKYIKALMLARLNTLSKGHSGIHPSLTDLLSKLINNNILPDIYEHGGLGASGDLVQLAHLALCLIGEGSVTYKGKKITAAEAYQDAEIEPIKFHIREALAIMNGTSAMTGFGAVNLIRSKNLLNWSMLASATLMEIVSCYDDYYSEKLNQVKLHRGQQEIAAQIRNILKDSKRWRKREEHLYKKDQEETVNEDKVQEYYSIRCIPQIVGAILETIENAEQVVENEINSVSDNPIIDPETENVYHGGNFHGDYVSLEMDKLKIAVTKLSMLIERQLNYLLNNSLNKILPPFVNLGTLGLNLGMQGAQFVATSTTAENQSLCFPNYVHSIPSNNDNQDIVSMGANSALIAGKVINNSFEVLAVHYTTILQAVEYLGIRDKMSTATGAAYDKMREFVPPFKEDFVIHEFTHQVGRFLQEERASNYCEF